MNILRRKCLEKFFVCRYDISISLSYSESVEYLLLLSVILITYYSLFDGTQNSFKIKLIINIKILICLTILVQNYVSTRFILFYLS